MIEDIQLITADFKVKDEIGMLEGAQKPEVIVVKDARLAKSEYFVFTKPKLLEMLKQTKGESTLAQMICTYGLKQAITCPFEDLVHPTTVDTVVLKGNDVAGVLMASVGDIPIKISKGLDLDLDIDTPFDAVIDSHLVAADLGSGFDPNGASIAYHSVDSDNGGGNEDTSYSMDKDEAGPPTDDQLPPEDPPRSAYALLDCPNSVPADQEFELRIGLSKNPTPGVSGKKLRRPDSSLGSYTIKIELVHDGFLLQKDESSIQELWVTADDPYPQVVLHLTAEEDVNLQQNRLMLAYFYVDHQMISSAVRTVTVVEAGIQPTPAVAEAEVIAGKVMAGVDTTVPSGQLAPDLTIVIAKSNKTSSGYLQWHLESKHTELKLPKEIPPIDIGDSPEAFAKKLMNQVNMREREEDLFDFLVGTGKKIAENIPYEVRKAIRELSNRIPDRAPSVLIVTQEPYVPWELAFLDLGQRGEGFFATEFIVGRWILGVKMDDEGRMRPQLPPPTELRVEDMIVISGNYEQIRGWNRLKEAEQEAENIAENYNADPVNATLNEIRSCLKKGPDADLLHFAVHGKYDQSGIRDGLAMVDGKMLDPTVIKRYSFTRAPFVFLNACQVGQGNRILGDYAGMAGAFLSAGASAVIAPLFSINDKKARKIAEDFYRDIKNGRSPAEILRKDRAQFNENNPELSSTFIAYQFFGHPSMHLELRIN